MGHILSENDRTQLDQQIAEAEKRTKVQIILAAVKRSDSYAELPWKAFALGASIAGLLVFVLDLLLPGWISNAMLLVSVAATLAAGAVLALLTVLLPGLARLFLSAHRAEAEVRQYAESFFLSREMFATSRRSGILLLVSLFERQIIILPDKGLGNRLSADALQNIIMQMSQPLAKKEVKRAMEAGLKELIKVLEPSASAGPAKNELSDEIIEEKGV
jgi:putative membrane protein